MLPVLVTAQAPKKLTYEDHIKPIIDKNCVECHKTGGIGPFTLDTYESIAKRADFIAEVTQSRYMPPFRADKSFQHYANERGLSDSEIAMIQQWATSNELLKGTAKALPKSSKKNASINHDKSAIVLKMQQPFRVPDTGEEEFRYFHIPTNLKKEIFAEAIEFIPGNRKVLHHSRVMMDTSGLMQRIEGIRADDPLLNDLQKTPMADQFLYGWVPGNDRIRFPKGIAKKINTGANLIVNMHYSPSSKVAFDQSEIRLYPSRTTVEREVRSLLLTEENISNKPFLIKADTKPTFYMSLGPIQEDISAISVLPHMHWLGKTFKAFAITPDGDLVPLIKIDNWDFNWQMTYQFQYLLKIPKGSILLAEATFDNTTDNPFNPFKPTRDITYGWNSTAEMLEMVLYYVPYRQGDEKTKQ